MKMRLRGPFYTGIALGLCGLLLLMDLSPLVAAAAEGGGDRRALRIAVLPVINRSGAGGVEMSERATQILVRRLSATNEFEVVPVEDLQKVMQALNLRVPASLDDQVKVGKLVNADRVAQFTLELANAASGKDKRNGKSPPALELHGQVIRVSDGKVAARIYTRNQNPSGKVGSAADRDQAVRELVADAISQMVELTSMRGVVGLKRIFPFVRTSLGTKDGLRPGAELEFFDDNGASICYGDAIEVDTGSSLVRVQPESFYSRMLQNTSVRPVYNPPSYAAGLTLAQIDARSERNDEINFGIAVALALIGIRWYTHSGSSSAAATGGGVTPPPPPPPGP